MKKSLIIGSNGRNQSNKYFNSRPNRHDVSDQIHTFVYNLTTQVPHTIIYLQLVLSTLHILRITVILAFLL